MIKIKALVLADDVLVWAQALIPRLEFTLAIPNSWWSIWTDRYALLEVPYSTTTRPRDCHTAQIILYQSIGALSVGAVVYCLDEIR